MYMYMYIHVGIYKDSLVICHSVTGRDVGKERERCTEAPSVLLSN